MGQERRIQPAFRVSVLCYLMQMKQGLQPSSSEGHGLCSQVSWDWSPRCLLLKVLYSVAFPHLFGPIYPPTPLPPSDLSWTYCAYQCLLAYALPVCPPNAVCSSAPTPGVPGLQASAPVFSAPSVCSWCLQLTSIILWALKLTPVLFRMFN